MINFQQYAKWLKETKKSIFPESSEIISFSELKSAAVSIILIEDSYFGSQEKKKYSITFAKRSNSVPRHKGQIAFPGGGLHKNETLIETAIRETREEIGINIDLESPEWELLGEYPKNFVSVSDYLITPFIFLYTPKNGNKIEYVPDEYEIVEAFDVPLEHLLNPKNMRIEKREWQGVLFDIHYYKYKDRTIWGVTGMLLNDFLTNLPLN